MKASLLKLTLSDWDDRYEQLCAEGLMERPYGGKLSRHVESEGDLRLRELSFDSSAASLQLWNFLLTENERLRQARAAGETLIGTMKDLGTIPVMAYSLPRVRAFYPDGAWWTPCLMQCSDRLFQQADALGVDDSFCPVRAMLGAFDTGEHFPLPDRLICSAGAVCDDFSAVAQRLECMGHPVEWWEMPRRRSPRSDEPSCELPGGFKAPREQVTWVAQELQRIARVLEETAGEELSNTRLTEGIQRANRVRTKLARLRNQVYGAPRAPLPALEMLIAEMLAIHYCSDRDECEIVLDDLLMEVERRLKTGDFVLRPDAVRVFWVNPVADLRAMNRLEEWGGRVCGSDYLFTHALDSIPETVAPMEALARTALADPMVGPTQDRAERIIRDCRRFQSEALVVSRIPGASHCAHEGEVICELVRGELEIPAIELEIPSICDAMAPALSARVQTLLEMARARRTE